MRIILLIITMSIFTLNAFADIYMQENANGVTKFTDTPSKDAEKVKLNSNGIVTSKPPVSSLPITTKTDTTPTPVPLRPFYNVFRLIEPKDKQTFQNQPEIPVILEVEPALYEGDKIQVYLDGQPYGNALPATSFQLQILERGTHTVSAKLIDKNGKVIRETKTITIYVHRHSIITAPN